MITGPAWALEGRTFAAATSGQTRAVYRLNRSAAWRQNTTLRQCFSYAAMAMGDGGHHTRLGGVGDFCGSNDHVCCLRLHSHEETKSPQTEVDSSTRRVYLITMILLRGRSVCVASASVTFRITTE
jgi:hypothetical protein